MVIAAIAANWVIGPLADAAARLAMALYGDQAGAWIRMAMGLGSNVVLPSICSVLSYLLLLPEVRDAIREHRGLSPFKRPSVIAVCVGVGVAVLARLVFLGPGRMLVGALLLRFFSSSVPVPWVPIVLFTLVYNVVPAIAAVATVTRLLPPPLRQSI